MSVFIEIITHAYPELVKHEQKSKNYGLLGGWLIVETWCLPSGDPTGITESRVEYDVRN